MLGAPFVQMMTMYDYGCEKHYGRPVPTRAKGMSKDEIDAMKARIAGAEARLRG